MHRYLIGSGFFCNDEADPRWDFANIWLANTKKYAQPSRIIVISTNGSLPLQGPFKAAEGCDVIRLGGNLGHFMEIVNRQKPHKFSGWFGDLMALAMLAYCDEADLIYKEQDCLAFGPWVERMYADIGNAGVLFGYKHRSPPWQCCSQSLMLIRHRYLPDFVNIITGSAHQAEPGQLGEHKFEQFQQRWPDEWKHMTFGVDRERPLPLDDEVFYCQQLKPDELQALRDKGLV